MPEKLSPEEEIELLWLEMKTYLDLKANTEDQFVDIMDMAEYLHTLGYRKVA
jgi:hypothetical protein